MARMKIMMRAAVNKGEYGISYSGFLVPIFFAFLTISIIKMAASPPDKIPPALIILMKSALWKNSRARKSKTGTEMVYNHALVLDLLKSNANMSVRAIEIERYAVNMVIIPRRMNGFPRARVAI